VSLQGIRGQGVVAVADFVTHQTTLLHTGQRFLQTP